MIRGAARIIKQTAFRSFVYYNTLTGKLGKGKDNYLTPDVWGMEIAPSGHLVVQGCDITKLAQEYGTPLYIVDKQKLEKNYSDFLISFQKHYQNCEIAYSYKTNPLPAVLKILHNCGASAEVISPFELWLALKLQVPPKKIIYNGPAKTEEALSLAVSNKISLINLDGPTEIELIDRIAKKYSHKQAVGLRVVTSVGWSSQFGFNIEDGSAFRAFRDLSKLLHVDPCGLHLHLGTGIKNIETYCQAIKEILEFSVKLREDLGLSIRYFDIGGGFGVPTVRQYTDLDRRYFANNLLPPELSSSTCPLISDFSSPITELFQRYYPATAGGRPKIILEPGRAITSSAQSLLLKVVSIKPGENSCSLINLDGGSNIAMPTRWEHHAIFPVSKMTTPKKKSCSVYGPLCHPHDMLYKLIKLPELKLGDLLLIMDAGAYFIPNQMNFSYPRPSAVLVKNGRHKIIRARESFEDII